MALLVFGGEVIRSFSFAMLFGILIGTYSSVFIAAPLLGYLGVKRDNVGSAVKSKEPKEVDVVKTKAPEQATTKPPQGVKAKASSRRT